MTEQRFIQPQRQGVSSTTGIIANSELTFPKAAGYTGHVNGVAQHRNRAMVCPGTDGIVQYTAQEWLDQTTGDTRYSCNCPGWTRFSHRGGDRWCSHTRQLANDITLGLLTRQDVPNNSQSASNHKQLVDEPGDIVAPRVRRRIG